MKAVYKDGSGGLWIKKSVAERQVGGSLKLEQLTKQGLLRERRERIDGKAVKLYNVADLGTKRQ